MKPKLLFVYDHPRPEWWQDGLSAALDVLEEDFEIDRANLHNSPYTKHSSGLHDNYDGMDDFILGWGAFGSSVDKFLQSSQVKTPKGLCVAGNATATEGADNYQVLFAETDYIINNYLPKHKNIVKAFGVNTDLFNPIDIAVPIVWDYIGVGAFASWKRWEKMIDLPGTKLVIGEVQEGNLEESMGIIRTLVRNGVMVSPMINPLDLAMMYHYSRTLYAPADIYGGCERSILEARSCGLSVLVEDDNPKLKELTTGDIPSHKDYAKALKDAILKLI